MPSNDLRNFQVTLANLCSALGHHTAVLCGDFSSHIYAWELKTDRFGDALHDFSSSVHFEVANVPQDLTFPNSRGHKSVIDLFLFVYLTLLQWKPSSKNRQTGLYLSTTFPLLWRSEGRFQLQKYL